MSVMLPMILVRNQIRNMLGRDFEIWPVRVNNYKNKLHNIPEQQRPQLSVYIKKSSHNPFTLILLS